MRVLIADKISSKPIRALMDGVAAAGDCPVLMNPNVWKGQIDADADAVVVNGLGPVMSPVWRAYKSRDVPTYVVEQGHIGRGDYWQLGREQLNWMPPLDCPGDRRLALGLEYPETQSNPDGPILFLGQKPGDAQTWNINVYAWHADTMSLIREFTDRPFVYRVHPKDKTGKLPWLGEFGVQDPDAVPLEDAFADAYAVVTLNSNAGIKALLSGVPTFCDPRAHYAEACETRMDRIEKPYRISKEAWTRTVNKITYAQWTEEELATGEPWQWLKAAQQEAIHAHETATV